MPTYLFESVLNRLERVWLYAERGFLIVQRKWCESEIEYLDRKIAQLERDE